MIRKVMSFLIIVFSFIPGFAMAQEPLILSAVNVSLWPEFDRPSMLVIYRLTLSPQIMLPVEMTLRVPSSAVINAVAAQNPNDSLYNINYSLDEVGPWSQLTFQATAPEIQIEFYDDALEVDGDARHYSYQWLGDYATDSSQLEVQQPIGATNMRISPSMGSGQPNADGLVYYRSDIGPLSQGQDFEISLDYEKSDDTLSQEYVSVAPSTPLDDNTLAINWSTYLPYILGGLGIFLLGGGAYWYWRSGSGGDSSPKRKRGTRRKASDQVRVKPEETSSHVYCHQCGNRAERGDRFCRSCGAQLRIN
jgi:hypothetical protein